MRIVLPLTITIILFTSCAKYQYFQLSSDTVPKDQKQQFVAENDVCRIIYDFSGAKGPINISVYNKTSKPLQVDWKRSSVIVGDTSISFFEPEMKFSGEMERSRYSVNQNVNGVITQPESLDFIPPQSSVAKQTRWVRSKPLKLDSASGQEIKTARRKAKLFKFTEKNSPVRFRTYLTLISENAPFYFDHSFYANEVIETSTAPQNFGTGTADRFYIKDKTDFGRVSTAVFGIGIAVLLIAAL